VRAITAGDLHDVARVHRAAFGSSALSALGAESVRRYYEWQLVGPHDLIALGVWHDGVLRAFCFGGRFRGAVSGFVRRNRFYLAARVLCTPRLLFGARARSRMATALRSLVARPASAPTRAPPTASSPESATAVAADLLFGILSIAVDPGAQRTGSGRRLIEAMETAARSGGYTVMNLTVEPSNLPAVAFYEKQGWARVLVGTEWAGAMRKQLTT